MKADLSQEVERKILKILRLSVLERLDAGRTIKSAFS
jgi:hypothetical protein